MEKYKHNNKEKIAVVISNMGAGMCNKTIGMTLVIYKHEGDTYDYPFVMEDIEFHMNYTKINK